MIGHLAVHWNPAVRVALDELVLAGSLGLEEPAGQVVVLDLALDEVVGPNPSDLPAVAAVALDDIVCGGRFDDEAVLVVQPLGPDQLVLVLVHPGHGDIAVREVRSREAVLLVVRDQPAALLQGRQVDPEIVLAVRMLDLQYARSLDVGGHAELDEQHRVDAVGLQLDEPGVPALAALIAAVDEDHGRLHAQRPHLGGEEVLLHDLPRGPLGGRRHCCPQEDAGEHRSGQPVPHCPPPPAGAIEPNSTSRRSPKTKRGLKIIISALRKNNAKKALMNIVAVTMLDSWL